MLGLGRRSEDELDSSLRSERQTIENLRHEISQVW